MLCRFESGLGHHLMIRACLAASGEHSETQQMLGFFMSVDLLRPESCICSS
jgi:hypothetical protein